MNKCGYHFIGIGGIGMSALAKILLEKKIKVTGSDASQNEMTEELERLGAKIELQHRKEAISPAVTVVYSSSIKKDNPEFVAAKENNAKLLHRSELLWELAKNHLSLAVAGTHGKTTTTSLLAYSLYHLGEDPSFAIGGYIPTLSNARRGGSNYFVFEADESDGSFLNYLPSGAIVTNVECDHMEHFITKEKVKESFQRFLSQVQSENLLFYCGDDLVLSSMRLKGFSYGFDSHLDLVIENFKQKGFEISFDIRFEKKSYLGISLPLTGRHNALNGAAVFGLLLKLGFSEDKIKEAFASFPQVKRRLEKRAETNGISFYDDYAHHPTEIKSTLSALKSAISERRLIAIFQPHRYTRLSYFFNEFALAFERADQLIVTDLYSAGEEPMENISAEALVKQIQESATVPVAYIPREDLPSHLAELLYPHDVVITLGAGNLPSMHPLFVHQIEKREKKKYTVGVVFGGKSCEHEVSLRSARFVISSLDKEYYDVKCFGIDKSGLWIVGEEAKELLETKTSLEAMTGKSFLSSEIAKELEACDLFFPILHGPFGEDGTIQGFFEMIQKPYAGPNFRSSAIAMDKVITKEILLEHGIMTAPFLTFSYELYLKDPDGAILQIEKKVNYPCIVKPRHLGSSVGVNAVDNVGELKRAIDFAFRYDTDIIVEVRKTNCREIEFPVLGSDQKIEVAKPGEKLTYGRVLDYEMKYSSNAAKVDLEPEIEESILKKGQEIAKKAYRALGIEGMARVDCLLDREGNFWVMEVNTIPGMTSLSLFPKAWARDGLASGKLMDRLVISAIHKFEKVVRHQRVLE